MPVLIRYDMEKRMKDKTTASKKSSIGGQALIEGVMMKGPEKVAMTVRHTSGEMRMACPEQKESKRPALFRKPFIRGIFMFIDSMLLGSKCLLDSAELAGYEDDVLQEKEHLSKEENEKRQKRFMKVLTTISMVLGVVLALGLFFWLPIGIYNELKAIFPVLDDRALQSIFEGLFKIVIFLIYVWAITFMKDIRRVFMYHGAEHKTIACYEHDLPLTVEHVRMQSRFHPRCGTSFIFLVLFISIVVGLFIPHSIPALLRTAIKLLLLPLTMGIGYEVLRFTGRKDNLFTRVVSRPGMWIQRLTTKEPEDGMMECAIASFIAVLPDDDYRKEVARLKEMGAPLPYGVQDEAEEAAEEESAERGASTEAE